MPFSVAVLAHDRPSAFHLGVPGVVFGEVDAVRPQERWTVRVCAHRPGPLPTSDGCALVVEHGLDVLASADLAIVPSWRHPDVEPPAEVLDALRAARSRGAVVAGLCLGAFVLAAAGLLDGRRATTHWRAAARLAERYPRVEVDPRVLCVDDGEVVTSAGTAASIDACLHVVRTRLGSTVATLVARGIVAAPFREGGQAQYIERPVPVDPGEGPLSRTVRWAAENLHERLTVDVLAGRAHMSTRTFERAFRRSVGCAPAAWVRQQRLREAQHLLESTALPVGRIAQLCGFGSAVTLRQSFVAHLGVPPATYRRTFAPAVLPPGRRHPPL